MSKRAQKDNNKIIFALFVICTLAAAFAFSGSSAFITKIIIGITIFNYVNLYFISKELREDANVKEKYRDRETKNNF